MSSIPDSAVARRGDDHAAVGREYWIEVACAGEALPRRPLSFVEATANTTILRLSGATTPTISDWRVKDLELDGLSGASSVGVGAEGGINQVTLLRLNIHDIHVGIIFSSSTLDFWNSDGNLGHSGHKMWDQLTVFDSTISRAIGGGAGYGTFLRPGVFPTSANRCFL